MKLNIPKIDFSKIEKKYLIAVPAIILIFILPMCMDSSQNPSEQTQNGSNQTTQEESEHMENRVEHTVLFYEQDENHFDYNKEVSVEENNQLNINRGGMIVRHADYYYYSDENFGMIYRVKLDGTGRKKIDYATNSNNLNIDADWIYFTSRVFDADDELVSAKVYKLNLNDGRRSISNIHADTMILDESHIYFTNIKDNNRLYRVTHDFENLELLTEEFGIKSFYIEDEFIYYLDSFGINRINKNGANRHTKVQTSNIRNFIIKQDRIFYVTKTDDRLFVKPKGRTAERELLMDGVYEFYIYGENIHYAPSSQRSGLQITRIRDTSVSLGRVNTGSTYTILGNIIFNSRSANALGYNQKIFLDIERTEPLSIDTREVSLGLNEQRISDYVKLNIDYDDRNTITRNIFDRLGEFFDGNSYPVFADFADIDQNYLNEGFIIFRQYVSINNNQVSGLGKYNDIQAGLYLLRWDEKDLQILGPYPLRNERNIARGEFIKPSLRLNNVTDNNSNEIIINIKEDMDIQDLELFAVHSVHIEPLDPSDFQERLSIYGY